MAKADKAQRFPDLLLSVQEEASRAHGRLLTTFKFSILGLEQCVTVDPRNIQAMLATQFDDFGLGPVRRAVMLPTLGDGIFVQDGKAWAHSRSLLRPQFVREQVSDLDLEERHVQNLMRLLPAKDGGWTAETDIQTLFFRLTLDSASDFLFGESVDSQLGEAGLSANKTAEQLGREKQFARNFDSAQAHAARRFRLNNLYWLYNPKEFRDNNKVVNDFITHYVNLALEKGSSEKKTEQGRQSERYVFLEELAQRTRDPTELRAQLLNILLAGRDTTASLMSWFFHELLRHPDVFDKLRSTVISTFGTYDNPRNLSFSDLKGCQYLQLCLNETLRLWPVVPGNARQCNKMTTLPRGGGPDGESPVLLAPGTLVGYSVHVMHRCKAFWGDDADEFRPERFIGRKPGWEFLPFNGGPRICIGQQFAITEASYVTVRLLQRFDRIEADPSHLEGPVRSNLTLTNCPGSPVTLRLHEAR